LQSPIHQSINHQSLPLTINSSHLNLKIRASHEFETIRQRADVLSKVNLLKVIEKATATTINFSGWLVFFFLAVNNLLLHKLVLTRQLNVFSSTDRNHGSRPPISLPLGLLLLLHLCLHLHHFKGPSSDRARDASFLLCGESVQEE
jgi:hypothetical protein